jgi:hypothetical protein
MEERRRIFKWQVAVIFFLVALIVVSLVVVVGDEVSLAQPQGKNVTFQISDSMGTSSSISAGSPSSSTGR